MGRYKMFSLRVEIARGETGKNEDRVDRGLEEGDKEGQGETKKRRKKKMCMEQWKAGEEGGGAEVLVVSPDVGASMTSAPRWP